MKNLSFQCVLALCLVLLFSVPGFCSPLKRVYLRDGGIIECRSFGQSNGKISVVVNRDVVIELTRNEVDLKRTFASPPHRKKLQRASAASPAAVKDQKTVTQAAAATPAANGPAPRQGKMSSAKTPPAAPAPKQTGGSVTSPPPPAKPAASTPAPAATPPAPAPPDKPAPPASALPAAPGPAAAPLAAMLGFGTLLPFLLILLLLIASIWKIFAKAGEAGWKALIPIYNVFVLLRIAGKPWWWFLLLLIPGVNVVISIILNISLADRFGKGALFGLGLAFLGFIFYPILAFGNAEYD